MKVRELINELEKLNPELVIQAVLVPTAWNPPINLKKADNIILYEIKEVTLSKPNVIAIAVG